MDGTEHSEDTPGEVLPATRALNSSNRLTALRALRRALAISIREAQPHQRAQLGKQLRETLAEIDGLMMPKRMPPPAKESDEIDEISAQRAKRRGDPAAS